MVVAIVSASSLSGAQAPDSTADGLQPLLAKFNPNTSPVMAAPKVGAVSDLLSRLQKQAASTRAVSTEGNYKSDQEPADQSPDRRAQDREAAAQSAQGADTGVGPAGSPAALWGLVEPCWRSLSLGSPRPVTLSVTLDMQGRIAKPPQILRTGSTPDEPQLRSEALALQGLAACMPRNGSQFGGKTYRLKFSAATSE
jgi:hypothetical protein